MTAVLLRSVSLAHPFSFPQVSDEKTGGVADVETDADIPC